MLEMLPSALDFSFWDFFSIFSTLGHPHQVVSNSSLSTWVFLSAANEEMFADYLGLFCLLKVYCLGLFFLLNSLLNCFFSE
jgi:hypothetical protein